MNLLTVLISVGLNAYIFLMGLEWFQIVKKTQWIQKQSYEKADIFHTSLQFLLKDIQKSGYRGCRSTDLQFPIRRVYDSNNPNYQYFRFDRALYAFKASLGLCYGKLPHSVCEQIKPDSEVLILYNIPQKITHLKHEQKSREDTIVTLEKPEIWENSLVLISDCQAADVFITPLIKDNIIFHPKVIQKNSSDAFSKAYGLDALVTELQTVAYYVARSEPRFEKTLNTQNVQNNINNLSNINNNEDANYALFRKDFIHRSDELVKGVVDLKFEFAIRDKNNQTTHYVNSEQMQEENWPKVGSVRIHIKTNHEETLFYEIALRNRIGLY